MENNQVPEKSTRSELLKLIKQFLEQNPHITPANFGWVSARDTLLVPRLEKGGDITTRKLDDVIRYMGNPNS